MDTQPKETLYDIEKDVELKESRAAVNEEITFDNSGNMVFNNRAFRRNSKRLWRAVNEGHQSIHFYTHPSGIEKPKTNRESRKRERQNRLAGRRHNGLS